jgi:hypothetical protein
MKVRCEFVDADGWQCKRLAPEGEVYCKEHQPGSHFVWVSLGEEQGIERGYYRQRPPVEPAGPPAADPDRS